MNVQLYFRRFWLMSLVILAGCGGANLNLDTNERKLLAAETLYTELVTTAIEMQPRMSIATQNKVYDLFENTYSALVLAREAYAIGNDLDFSSNIATVNTLLQVLRPILIEIEANQ